MLNDSQEIFNYKNFLTLDPVKHIKDLTRMIASHYDEGVQHY
jgi:hypothetical protein